MFVNVSCCRNATSLLYFGLMYYFPDLGPNPYLSLLFLGLVEVSASDRKSFTCLYQPINYALLQVPAVIYAQTASDTCLGRKYNLIGCFFISGVFLLCLNVIPEGNPWAVLALAIVGKWGVSVNFNLLFLVTSEIYPTSMRTAALAMTSMLGRFGSVLSPFLTQLVSDNTKT